MKGWYTAMKKHQRISILLTCLLLALPLQTAVTEPLQINAAEALPAGGITTTAVSYTHLDVYKRQTEDRAAMKMMLFQPMVCQTPDSTYRGTKQDSFPRILVFRDTI